MFGKVAKSGDEDTEIAALTKFYNATGGPHWAVHTNWLSDKPLNQWHGVEVNKMGLVLKLKLINNNLSGIIPSDCLGSLRCLEKIKLYDNPGLHGSIPRDVSNLHLEYIQLDVKSFGLPEAWVTMKGKDQIDWIKANAVKPKIIRNNDTLIRMPAVAMAWLNAWNDLDRENFNAHSNPDIVYKISSMSFNGLDFVWEHRASLSDKPLAINPTLVSWDLRDDTSLNGFVKYFNPFTGELLTFQNVIFDFDLKCRQVTSVTFTTIFDTPADEKAAIYEKIAAKEQADILKKQQEEESKNKKSEEERLAALAKDAEEQLITKLEEAEIQAHIDREIAEARRLEEEKALLKKPPPEKIGKLTKRARGFPYNWKQRKFHLLDGSLLFYETTSSDARNDILKGSIDNLKNYTIQVHDRKSLEFIARYENATDAHNRELLMRADNNANFDSWIEALQKHIAYASRNK